MPRTTGILDLSDELLFDVLCLYLDPASVARMGGTCRRLLSLSNTNGLWEKFMIPFEGIDTHGQQASSQLFGSLFQPRTPGWKCDMCSDRLFVSSTDHQDRCVCVCRRVLLPLTIMAFSPRRCRSSSLARGFTQMIQALTENFNFDLQLVDALPETIHGVDMLVLCTTEGPELTETEQHSLIEFVRNGGTAILSAFSNWSAFGHFNRKLTEWLGVSVIPRAHFMSEQRATLVPGLSSGPWDCQGNNFINKGENEFHLDVIGGSRVTRTCAYFPRGHELTAKGQVFVCSNYHWIADIHHWAGGTFHEGANRHILLNMAANAVVQRPSAEEPV